MSIWTKPAVFWWINFDPQLYIYIYVYMYIYIYMVPPVSKPKPGYLGGGGVAYIYIYKYISPSLSTVQRSLARGESNSFAFARNSERGAVQLAARRGGAASLASAHRGGEGGGGVGKRREETCFRCAVACASWLFSVYFLLLKRTFKLLSTGCKGIHHYCICFYVLKGIHVLFALM